MSQFVSSLCVPINFSTAQPKTAIQSKSKFCSAFFRGVYRVMLWTCTCNVSALLSAKSSCWSVWPIKWQSERANAGIPLVNGFKRFHQHAQIASLVSKIDALLKNILLKIHMWKTDIWKIHLFCWFRPAASPASQGAPSSSQLLLSPRYILFLAETAAHSLFLGGTARMAVGSKDIFVCPKTKKSERGDAKAGAYPTLPDSDNKRWDKNRLTWFLTKVI